MQELLWTLVHLTDEDGAGGPPAAGPGGAWDSSTAQQAAHAQVAGRLAPLLYLYGMPWHAQHGHLAALVTR